jgi:hypothetical protein
LALWLGMIGENDIQIAQQDALQRWREKDRAWQSTPLYAHWCKAIKLVASAHVSKEARKKDVYRLNKCRWLQ